MSSQDLSTMTHDEKQAIAEKRIKDLRTLLIQSTKGIKSFHAHVPNSMERLYLEVLVGKSPSNSKRIRLKCLDCSGFSRDEVKNCELTSCALHEIRPFQDKKL